MMQLDLQFAILYLYMQIFFFKSEGNLNMQIDAWIN